MEILDANFLIIPLKSVPLPVTANLKNGRNDYRNRKIMLASHREK